MGRVLPDSEMAFLGRRRSRPQRNPSLADVRGQLLPQLVPTVLVKDSAQTGRELAAIGYAGDISVAFVIDEPDRYLYIQRRLMRRWQVAETDLLTLALRNLAESSNGLPPAVQIGQGKRLALVWECFDGYDASRLLLTRQLCEAAVHVAGNPVIAVPHRDYMVMFGDGDSSFVAEMVDRIEDEFGQHRYPITSQLYTLQQGAIAPYDLSTRPGRVIH